MHSAFYMIPLEVLLQHLQVETVILTGLTSNSCITVTAHDADTCAASTSTFPGLLVCAKCGGTQSGTKAVEGDGGSRPAALKFVEAFEPHSMNLAVRRNDGFLWLEDRFSG